MWWSKCFENNRKTNVRHFFCNVVGCKTQISMGLGQGDLIKKFKENNLPIVSFLKLLTKENSMYVFISLQLKN